MSFIATNQEEAESQVIPNLGFFPDIDLLVFRETYKVDDTVTGMRTVNALTRAIISINAELQQYRKDREAEGIAKLADVEADMYGEAEAAESALVYHYRTAIFSRAKAHILEAYRNFDSTNDGHDRADELENQGDGYLATARTSIRAILGRAKCTVELI